MIRTKSKVEKTVFVKPVKEHKIPKESSEEKKAVKRTKKTKKKND